MRFGKKKEDVIAVAESDMTINNTDETKIIFSRNVAIKLRERGFDIIRTEVNKTNPQYDCYEFKNTPEFQKAFVEIAGTK